MLNAFLKQRPHFIFTSLVLLSLSLILLSSCATPTPQVVVVTRLVPEWIPPTEDIRPPPTKTRQLEERILEIQETDRRFRIVGETRIPARNCVGNNEIEFSQALSYSIRRHIDVGAKGEVSIGDLKLSWLKAALEAHYSFQEGEEVSQTATVTIHAKPGSNLMYRVAWKEVSATGYMIVQKDNGERVTIPFTVTKSLEAEILDPVDVGCSPTPTVETK